MSMRDFLKGVRSIADGLASIGEGMASISLFPRPPKRKSKKESEGPR